MDFGFYSEGFKAWGFCYKRRASRHLFVDIRFIGNEPSMSELWHFEVIDRIGPWMKKLANQSHT